jgi:lincosamide nucleotidyltransferase A/C/D/E
MVTTNDAAEIVGLFEENGIEVFLDGGWGVDALLGYESREHNDIDIFIEAVNEKKALELLNRCRFHEKRMDYTTPSHSVWQNEKRCIIDLHLFSKDSDHNIVFEGETYPADVFSGSGTIGNRKVNCIPPEFQVQFHLGYERDENDIKDVLLLCDAFNLEIPQEILDDIHRMRKA